MDMNFEKTLSPLDAEEQKRMYVRIIRGLQDANTTLREQQHYAEDPQVMRDLDASINQNNALIEEYKKMMERLAKDDK